MININFYDIESLNNVFTLANFRNKDNVIDLYYLVDDTQLLTDPNFDANVKDAIYKANHNFDGTIRLFDLSQEDACKHMAKTFGLSGAKYINNKKAYDPYDKKYRIVCDTDKEYDPEKHPYFMGYNSYNYDTTMLAVFFNETLYICTERKNLGPDHQKEIVQFKHTTAGKMREVNNDLFTDEFKGQMSSYLSRTKTANNTFEPSDYSDIRWIIRKNMLMSGRHIDVARLNEKQQKVGLKRLLGMLGFQILESDKLKTGQDTITTQEQLYDLFAYNVSDVVNLQELFNHKLYRSQFDLKKGMLEEYPELVYDRDGSNYRPKIAPDNVRRDRLFIDSSSAQFATKSLCPYGHLSDMDVVSFNYPHEEKAKELGIPVVNVLDEAKKFFYGLFPQQELREKFDRVYDYYKSIEGKNFNSSENYKSDPHTSTEPSVNAPLNMRDVEKTDTCMEYFDRNGNPTSCFVTFSTGGVHGAEYNKELFDYDMEQYRVRKADMDYVQSVYPNPVDLRQAKQIEMPDGSIRPWKDFLRSGRTIPNSEYRDIGKEKPQLFKFKDDGSTQLNQKYVYTSSAKANHEDFTSYYPNLLRMMQAFWNEGLGVDRYAEIFDKKQEYGRYMKDQSYSKEERDRFDILRNGTKLVLNSASGAGDAKFESNIRMNNTIISMRIIGQLFSWRIGQAQAYEGSSVISTNTDGLYSVMEENLNNQILERESASIHVDIEPEPLFLVSKDTNNRIEFDDASGKILSASGGTLACRKGPDPGKALAHPAIIDWALSEYLIVASQGYKGLSLDAPFDETIGRNILASAANKFDPVSLLLMYQNILASSPGSISYIYGVTDDNPNEAIVLQHYNRVFIMKDNTPGTVHLWTAVARVITEATKRKRIRDGENRDRIERKDPIPWKVLQANGITTAPAGKDIAQKKVTGIDPHWYMLILNKDLHRLSGDEIRFVMDNLDYEKYLLLLHECFEHNWRNHLPGGIKDDISVTDGDESDTNTES